MSRSLLLAAGWKSSGATTRRYHHPTGATIHTDAMGMWIGTRSDGPRSTFVNRDSAAAWALGIEPSARAKMTRSAHEQRYAQHDADILATVRAIGPAPVEDIVDRSGYALPGVNMRLRRLMAEGLVKRRRADRPLGSRGQVAYLYEVAA